MTDHPTSLMLFAAGLGTRMGLLTKDRPKPLIPVNGRPLIDHALGWVQDAGIKKVVVNTHYKAEMIHAHLSDQNISFSPEIDTVLETGGGLRRALPLLGSGPVFTFNPDAVWKGPNPLSLLRSAWRPDQMDALLMLVPQQRASAHSGRGDFVTDRDGRLMRGPGQIYTGAQIVRTDLLNRIPKEVFSLNLLWDDLLGSGRVFGMSYPGQWCDVGTPEGIGAAEAMLRGNDDV